MTKNIETNSNNIFLNHDIKACIFDLDGTLFDSLGFWSQIDIDFLSKRGFDVPVNYMDMISALSFSQTAKFTIDYFKLSDTVEELMEEWNHMAEEIYTTKVFLKPYTREFLELLIKNEYKLCVATSLTKRLYKPALINNKIYDLFDFTVSVDEVGSGKNEPEIWHYVTHRLNLKPKNCILFDDLYLSIKTAKSIGCCTCGVHDKHSDTFKDDLIATADYYIKDFSQNELKKIIK